MEVGAFYFILYSNNFIWIKIEYKEIKGRLIKISNLYYFSWVEREKKNKIFLRDPLKKFRQRCKIILNYHPILKYNIQLIYRLLY